MGRVKNASLDAEFDRAVGLPLGPPRTEQIAGRGVTKTIHYGQRVLIVAEPLPGCCPVVCAAHSLGEARSMVPKGSEDRFTIFWCETVDGQPFTAPE